MGGLNAPVLRASLPLAWLLMPGSTAWAAQSSPVEQAAPAGQATPAASATPTGAERAPDKFFVQAYDISGVTILSASEIERLVYAHSGPDRTDADVEAARKALQDAYAARGFGAAVVEVPVQERETFAQGVIRIAVNEVPVGQVRVTDSRYHSLWVARRQVPSLVEGKPLNIPALQADMTQANRFPDRTLNPIFKPGRAPGTIDVDINVDDQRPLHASVDLNNDASPATTQLRAIGTVRYTNLFQTGHSATFTYIVSPLKRKETEVFSGSYTFPLLRSPWSFAISGYYSNSNIAALGGTNVLGNGYQIGARAIYHLPSSGSQQQVSFGFDYKNFKQNILVAGVPTSTAPIRYLPLELEYTVAGGSEKVNYAVTLATTIGLRAIRPKVCASLTGPCVLVDAFRNREQFSNENFVRGDLSVDLSYAFKNDIVAAFRLNAQLADSHLITNEQFSAGGLRSVRGYYSSEAVGDNGIGPSLELRSPSLAGSFGKWLTEARFFAFGDASFLRVLNPLPEQTSSFTLVGIGGGLRVRIFDRISGEVLGAVAMTSGPVTKRGAPRVSFDVKGEF
jgi:hemolysin activation/secretion protein